MSSDRVAENGQNARLLRALVWGGVSLAPVAALVVMLGDSQGPIRFAVLLIAVCVVLVGASLLVRNDPVLLRMHVDERVAEEVGALREEMRSEIATVAARARPPAPMPPPPQMAPQMAPPPVREPGQRTGGRPMPNPGAAVGGAVVGGAARVASAPGWPDVEPRHGPVEPPPVPAVAPVAAAAGGPRGSAIRPVHGGRPSGGAPVPGQRGAASVPPPMAPVFQAPPEQPPAPQGGTYGAPRPAPRPGPHPPHPGGRPIQVRPPQSGHVVPPGRVPNPALRAPQQRSAHHAGEVYGSAEVADHSGDIYDSGDIYRSGDIYPSGEVLGPGSAGGVYGAPANAEDSAGDQGGKRRADVTAVDLGYTGRRSKPEDPAEAAAAPELDEEDDGYYGNGNYWEAGGFGNVDAGYPGWTEAEERYGKSW